MTTRKKMIFLTNNYKDVPLSILKSAIGDRFIVSCLTNPNDNALIQKAVSKADYILASGRFPVDEKLLKKAKKLKMIQRTGVGLDSIDLRYLKEKNIPLYVNAGVNSESVAELTLLFMLSCMRKITVIDSNLKQGIWNKQEQGVQTNELSGKCVALIGMGNIAKIIAKLLKPFKLDVIYYDIKKLPLSLEKEFGIRYVELDKLFSVSDIISLHCPLNKNTKHLINDKTISLMKDGVVLINTARGALIKTSDLIDHIKKNKFSFVALDVFEEEPVTTSELFEFSNVITTPHIGGITYESFSRMMSSAINNIQRFDEGDLESIEKYKYEFD